MKVTTSSGSVYTFDDDLRNVKREKGEGSNRLPFVDDRDSVPVLMASKPTVGERLVVSYLDVDTGTTRQFYTSAVESIDDGRAKAGEHKAPAGADA